MAKKQVTPKPVAKKVTPERLKAVSDSLKNDNGKLIGVMKNSRVYKGDIKPLVSRYVSNGKSADKYDAQLKAHASKKKK